MLPDHERISAWSQRRPYKLHPERGSSECACEILLAIRNKYWTTDGQVSLFSLFWHMDRVWSSRRENSFCEIMVRKTATTKNLFMCSLCSQFLYRVSANASWIEGHAHTMALFFFSPDIARMRSKEVAPVALLTMLSLHLLSYNACRQRCEAIIDWVWRSQNARHSTMAPSKSIDGTLSQKFYFREVGVIVSKAQLQKDWRSKTTTLGTTEFRNLVKFTIL